jgi:hypothetical protein
MAGLADKDTFVYTNGRSALFLRFHTVDSVVLGEITPPCNTPHNGTCTGVVYTMG